ncbi:YfiT family bacillithiol transferase [Larkinella soli]|uniref:YfiT family bacillithiol transferase n=1 Tax=Larkinella soli TaxID=1770527 RepID=UPI000FFBE5F5|nr:putative metal-dependent hydrolase [Larkinella soli]
MTDLDNLRYPIGRFQAGQSYTLDQNQEHLASIAIFPHNLTELVGKWGDDRLDKPYRPEGWTVRQLVHHIADSHINAYVRFRLALTQDNPAIVPYEEGEWAKLPDYKLSISPSLVILSNLHQRWVTALDPLTDALRQRTYFHPQHNRNISLSEALANYAWHGEHHYQHIHRLAQRNNWL